MKIRPLLLAVLVFTLVLFAGYDYAGAAIGFRASYSKNEVNTEAGGVESNTTTISKNYSLNFNKRLTNTISLNGDIRWTDMMADTNGVETNTKSSYPVFTLNYSPPAQYNVRFGYNRTESSPSQGERITSANTNAGFSLPSGKLPSLSLSFNKSEVEDHADVQQINSVTTSVKASSSYNFKYQESAMNVNYSYGLVTNEDIVGETTMTTPSHTFSTGANRGFLNDKLQASFNFGYDTRESTKESLGAASRFEETIGATSGLEDGPFVGTPLANTLVSEPQLIDNDTSTSAAPTIDLDDQNWNVGLGFSSPKDVHELHLYVNVVSPYTSASVDTHDFNWVVYSSTNNVTWTVLAGATVDYITTFNRFEFTFGETSAQYFKVVNTTGAAGGVEVTEIRALGYALATPKESYVTTTTRNFSGLTLAYVPTDRLSMGMSLTLDNSSRESDGAESTEVKNTRYGLNGRYVVIPKYLNFATTYASTISEPSDGNESETNSYTTTFSSTPLETVNTSFSYLYSENLLGGAVQSEDTSMNVSAFMAIYTGVDLNVGATFGTSNAPSSDTETESSSRRWGLKLKPWKPLIVLINSTTSSSDSTQSGVTTSSISKSLNMNVSYTPSRKLYMSADFDLKPEASQVYSLTWTPTRVVQCSVRYNSNESDSGFSSDLSWRPFKPLSLHTGYTVAWTDNATDDQTETLYTRVSVRF